MFSMVSGALRPDLGRILALGIRFFNCLFVKYSLFGIALRVSRAVTRLTVYRPHRVTRRAYKLLAVLIKSNSEAGVS